MAKFRRKTFRKKGKKRSVDKKQNKQIAKLIKANRADKSYRYTLSTGNFTKTWTNMILNQTMFLVNGLSQGAGTSQRVGDLITMNSFHLRMQIESKTSQAGNQNFHPFRMILLLDKCPDGIVPARDKILQPSPVPTDTTAYLAPLNQDYIKDYKVLYDKVYTMNSLSSVSHAGILEPQNISREIRINKYFKDMPVQYIKGTTDGTISNLASNALWLFIFSRYDDGCGFNINYIFKYSQ